MECEFPVINTPKSEFKTIFENTKTIAIVGCSPDVTKASNKVATYLINAGFTVLPIYPKEDFILGQKVYRSLLDIEITVDLVDIFRKPDVIATIVDECIQRGDVKYVWSQLGLVNNDAMEKAEKYGLKAVQNYCTKIEHGMIYNS
ncbi:MAG: CoA-binding protein [Arcobacteraceae bacterium]|jgi:predicted CoA-binding protein|nr:CoA-binding protein [Arcobacteraceae bacterium]